MENLKPAKNENHRLRFFLIACFLITIALLFISGLSFVTYGLHNGPLEVFSFFTPYLIIPTWIIGALYWRDKINVFSRKFKVVLIVFILFFIAYPVLTVKHHDNLSKKKLDEIYSKFKHPAIENVSDGFLYSDKGNPIGIKLGFSAIFPTSGNRYVAVNIKEESQQNYGLGVTSMTKISGLVDPKPENSNLFLETSGYYEKDTKYFFTFEFIPGLVWKGVGSSEKDCLLGDENKSMTLINNFSVDQMDISTTVDLNNEYSEKIFYDSFKKDGMPSCK